MSKPHKLTRQGVRDLGYSKKPTPREIPPQSSALCPHLQTGVDRFHNTRCRDCGAIIDHDWRTTR